MEENEAAMLRDLIWAKGQVQRICAQFDDECFKRKRVLNSQLLVSTILRLVSHPEQVGTKAVLDEFWDESGSQKVVLPQKKAVSASSFCEARSKLSERIFQQINGEFVGLLDRVTPPTWFGRRTFAVDATNINLPRSLIEDGYGLPNPSAYYPQGMLTCLYQLSTEVPVNFELSTVKNERQLAINHLSFLSTGDVIVYDRGYFSFGLMWKHLQAGVSFVMRLPENSNFKEVTAFLAGSAEEAVIRIRPTAQRRKKIRKRFGRDLPKELQVRVLRKVIGKTTYVFATDIMDTEISTHEFSQLYRSRWEIEEFFKVAKYFLEVEHFHSKSERGVKQELYAGFLLITITRFLVAKAKGMTTERSSLEQQAKAQKQSLKKSQISKMHYDLYENNFKQSFYALGLLER